MGSYNDLLDRNKDGNIEGSSLGGSFGLEVVTEVGYSDGIPDGKVSVKLEGYSLRVSEVGTELHSSDGM